jgi:formate hydrogenlyase subunit 6/NADH:ubiquinone oxidoreductase subunit I
MANPKVENHQPHIHYDRCVHCGWCVSYCEFGALVRDGKECIRMESEKCTVCRQCEDVCPRYAIFLPEK